MSEILGDPRHEEKIPGMLMVIANWNLVLSSGMFVLILHLMHMTTLGIPLVVVDVCALLLTIAVLVVISTLVIRQVHWVLRSEQLTLTAISLVIILNLVVLALQSTLMSLWLLGAATVIAVNAVMLFILTAVKIRRWFEHKKSWPKWLVGLILLWGVSLGVQLALESARLH